jgi:nucleoside-diphosphate-sugar epimerase
VTQYFITGGAGFLGINLVRHLLGRGHTVCSLDLVEFAYPERDRVQALTGDIRRVADVERALASFGPDDVVVHTAAALPLYSPADIHSTDVDGTRVVLEAAFKKGLRRLVHISSTAVYGIPDHHPLLEDDRLDGVGPYGQAKIAAEAVCLEYRQKGMCVPILRPKSFVGPERLGVFALFYDWAKDGKNFPLLGNGRNRYQLLDVEDLCEATYLAATLPIDRANDTFNIGASQFTTMREDFAAVLDEAGYGKKLVPLPAAPAIALLRLLERLGLSPLYKWVYETAAKDSFVSIDKAALKLGFTPRYSNRQALVRNYRWYLENLHRFQHDSGITHRVPWKQGALKLAKMVF